MRKGFSVWMVMALFLLHFYFGLCKELDGRDASGSLPAI